MKTVLTLLLCLVAWPADAASIERGFDVNDVNFLFPMTHIDAAPFYPDVPLITGDLDADLFGGILEQFMENTGGATGGDRFVAPNFRADELKYFHVVNFRYDPCFAGSMLNPSRCVQQIRLIAQPYNPDIRVENSGAFGRSGFDRGTQVPDFSMHLLFVLGHGMPAKNNPALSDMHALKHLIESTGSSQAGMVLQVSPALSQELQKQSEPIQLGSVAAKLKQLIQKYATAKNLDEVTVINGSSEDDDSLGNWNFVGGNIRSHQWVIEAIPRYGPRASHLQTSDTKGVIADEFDQSLPSPHLADPEKTPWEKMSDVEKLAQFKDLESIQNPRLFSPRTMDCASCHLAPIAEIKSLSQGRFPGIDSPDVFWRPPAGVTGFADPKLNSLSSRSADGFQNVHAIGYFEDSPVVTRMVAQSAAASAEAINTALGLQPPTTLNCQAVDALLCFLKIDADAQSCLKLCKQTTH